MIRAALRAFLAADAAAGPLVTGPDAQGDPVARVYSRPPEAQPRSTAGSLPRVTMKLLSAHWPRALDGIAGDQYARLRLECQAATSAAAVQLARAVRNATGDGTTPLHSFKGAMGDLDMAAAWFEDQRSDDAPPAHGGEQAIYTEVLELTVVYTEPS